jgi:hypothetical protein
VDGLDQDEHKDKRDNRSVIARSLLAAQSQALEAFRLANQDLDPRP